MLYNLAFTRFFILEEEDRCYGITWNKPQTQIVNIANKKAGDYRTKCACTLLGMHEFLCIRAHHIEYFWNLVRMN